MKNLQKKVEEVEKLKNVNHQLKILCGKTDSGWRNELDWVFYYEPDTGEPVGYDCPRNFSYGKVESIRYYLKDGVEWCTFWYKENYGQTYPDKYPMPKDAFLWLKGELPEQKKDRLKKIESIEIKEYDDIIEHIELFGFFGYNFRHLDSVYDDFLISYRDKKDKTFQRKYFTGKCNISPRTVSKYLVMLEKCHLIIKLPGRGKYKVNIK